MKLFVRFFSILAAFGLVSVSHGQVTYTETDVSGSTWQVNYTITNNFLKSSLNELTIYAPVGLYSNLSVAASPANWSSIVAQPDPNLPSAGFYDTLSTSGGLAVGATATGFSMQFTFAGTGMPGPQSFDIVDPKTFSTLYSGATSAKGGATSAPEIDPSSGIAGMTLLLGILTALRSRLRQHPLR